MNRAGLVAAALALAASACNLPGPADPIRDTTTTSTSPSSEPPPTTLVTLPPEERAERATVLDVVDGDTIVVAVDGAASEVRLLGINAPEREECYFSEARSVLGRMIDGRDVVLEASPSDVDDFGRSLRYVYLESEEEVLFVNAEMVAEGMAVAVQGDHAASAVLKSMESRAYASGLGFWGTLVCGQPDGGFPDRPQIRVAEISADPEGPDETALDDEWVEIVNDGYANVSLAGWVLRDESSTNRLTLPAGTTLGVGETLRVVSSCGSSGGTTYYWCADQPIWSNDGDTVLILDGYGNVVSRQVYRPGS